MNKIKHGILIVFFLFFAINNKAQFSWENNTGFSFGISFTTGTHINRAGLFVSAFVFKDFYQFGLKSTYYYNFSAFEGKKKYGEFQQNIVLLLSYGKTDSIKSPFVSPLINQTNRKNSFAYSYNFYWNKIETSQRTGILAFGFGRWQILSENDIFATQASDRFRTASLLIKYNFLDYSFGINTILWTGDPKGAKNIKDPNFKARYGYKDMSKQPYGNKSAGILSLQMEYALPYYQAVKIAGGIDSEKVRNALQNKLMHDMYFVPGKINKAQNPHMPMIANDGSIYTYKEHQKIKKARFYLRLAANENEFY